MATVSTTEAVRVVLDSSRGVIRLYELVDAVEHMAGVGFDLEPDELEVRRSVDCLILAGEVERAAAGDHIMVRVTDEFGGSETGHSIRLP